MALSGTITGTTSNSYISCKIVWSAKQSISGNYSDVTATLYYSRTNSGYTTSGTWKGGITINGTRTAGEKYLTITQNSNTVAVSATVRVYHNANGSKTITISADGGIAAASLTSTSISGQAPLDTIPRISQPTLSATSVQFGKTITITTNRASGDFTHKLYYKYGNSGWYEIATGVSTSYTWTVPLTLMTVIPNATSLSVTIGCDTYYNGGMLGEAHVTFTATVPTTTDCYPTIEGISWTKTSGEPSSWPMTQGVSKGTMAMTGVKGAYGSTIKTYSLQFAGLSSTASSLTVSNIANSGTLSAVAKVTDSRGRTTEKTVTFQVTAYSPPKLVVSVYRSNASGVEDAVGEYMCVKATPTITTVGDNAVQSLTLKYKQRSASSYTSVTLTAGTNKIVSASSNNTWDWIVAVADKINTVSSNGSIPTGEVVMDILANGKGVSFGKAAEGEGLESGWDFDAVNITASGKLKGASVEATSASATNATATNLTATNFTLGSTPMAFLKDIKDYVVEQGTSGIWTYRKWNSGVAECWGEGKFTINGWGVWGALYESTNTFQATYPSGLFNATPIVNITVSRTDVNNNIGTCGLEIFSGASKTQTPVCYALRPGAGAVGDIYLSIMARGRWK